VFRNEVELLKKNGIDVITYEKHNDEIKDYGLWDKVHLVFQNIWSRKAYQDIKNLIKKEKPDIAHFHNIWYLISPSAYSACADAGVPVVQTLHNFRFFCINGLLLRNSKICEECVGMAPWKGIQYGCYRDSKLYSIPLAVTDAVHQALKTLQKKVNCFIALTEFAKKKFVKCGLPAEKIEIKPNFLPDPPYFNYTHNGYGIYLGRITGEKGLNIVINAKNLLQLRFTKGIPIKIVGDGSLRNNLENVVSTGKINSIEFTGRRSFAECMKLLQNAKFLVLPSLCYEGFPMAIREAFACGKPVIASRLGGMAEIVEDGKTGLLFEAGNPEDLAEKLQWMTEHEKACIAMGKNARKEFEEKYTAERNFQILTGIYNKLIADG